MTGMNTPTGKSKACTERSRSVKSQPLTPSPHLPIPPSLEGGESQISALFDQLEMDRYSDIHLIFQELMETIVQIEEVTEDTEEQLTTNN